MFDYTIYLIALSLAIDCFVVSVALTFGSRILKRFYFLIPFHFGLFQGGMVLLGYYLGIFLIDLIKFFDHWIAFTLLLLVGINMIIESLKKHRKIIKIGYLTLILLSVATSIDAFAIGVTFSILDGLIISKSLVIAAFSLSLSIVGLAIGRRIKRLKFRNLGMIGGIILIGIGAKILIEHLFY